VWHGVHQRRPSLAQRVPRFAVVLLIRQEGEQPPRDLVTRAGRADGRVAELAAHGEGELDETAATRAPPVLIRCSGLAQFRGICRGQAAHVVDTWADIAARELARLAAHEAFIIFWVVDTLLLLGRSPAGVLGR